MNFTDYELELLIDSISWELEMLEQSKWNKCKRSQILSDLRTRIYMYRQLKVEISDIRRH
jgi:hypothetical protein